MAKKDSNIWCSNNSRLRRNAAIHYQTAGGQHTFHLFHPFCYCGARTLESHDAILCVQCL